jgi:hypothetical protein
MKVFYLIDRINSLIKEAFFVLLLQTYFCAANKIWALLYIFNRLELNLDYECYEWNEISFSVIYYLHD